LYGKKTGEVLEVRTTTVVTDGAPTFEMAVKGSPVRRLTKLPKILVEFHSTGPNSVLLGMGFVLKLEGCFYLVTAAHVMAAWVRCGTDAILKGSEGYVYQHLVKEHCKVKWYSEPRHLDIVFLELPERIRQKLGALPARPAQRVHSSQNVEVVGLVDKAPAFSNGALGDRHTVPYQALHFSSTCPGWSGAPVLTQGAQVIGVHLGALPSKGANRMLVLPDLIKSFISRKETTASERDFWKANFENISEPPSPTWLSYYASDGYFLESEYEPYALVAREGVSDVEVRNWVPKQRRSAWDVVGDDSDVESYMESLNCKSSSLAGGMSCGAVINPVAPPTLKAAVSAVSGAELVKVHSTSSQVTPRELPSCSESALKPKLTGGLSVEVPVKGAASSSKLAGSKLKSKKTSANCSQSMAMKSPATLGSGTQSASASPHFGSLGSLGTQQGLNVELERLLSETLNPVLHPASPILPSDIAQMLNALPIAKRKSLLSSYHALKDTEKSVSTGQRQ